MLCVSRYFFTPTPGGIYSGVHLITLVKTCLYPAVLPPNLTSMWRISTGNVDIEWCAFKLFSSRTTAQRDDLDNAPYTSFIIARNAEYRGSSCSKNQSRRKVTYQDKIDPSRRRIRDRAGLGVRRRITLSTQASGECSRDSRRKGTPQCMGRARPTHSNFRGAMATCSG